MSDADALIGTTFQGTFRIERLLGEGGHGAVYEASHERLERRFAIKLLQGQCAGSEEALARFQREARVTSSLGHPNIIEVTDFNFTPNGQPYLVMELLEGEDLATRIDVVGRLRGSEVLAIFGQVAAALSCAHRKNVIHRDLKPQNIFLCRSEAGDGDERVKVLDFGISKVFGMETTITRTGALVGTPHYMAPEQVAESGRIDHRVDIYSLGASIYQALSGISLHNASTLPALLYKITHTDPRSLEQICPGISPQVSAAVMKAVAREPEQRWVSVDAFWEAFSGAMAQQPQDYLAPLAPVQTDGAATAPTVAQIERSQVPASTTTLSSSVGEKHFAALDPPRRSGAVLPLLIAAGALIVGGATAVLLAGGGDEAKLQALSTPVAADSHVAVAPGEVADLSTRAPEDGRVEAPPTAPPTPRETTRTLTFSTRPSGARVLWRGRSLGTSPLRRVRIDTEPGVLTVSLRGYRGVRVKVGAGEDPLRFSPRLKRIARRQSKKPPPVAELTRLWVSALSSDSQPVSAFAYVDGKRIGETPAFRDLPPGPHQVEVRKLGFVTGSRRIMLRQGKVKKVTLRLIKARR